jgi:hypothetical protein
MSNSVSSAFTNEYKPIMQTLNQTICSLANDLTDLEGQNKVQPSNIYHLFLKFLFLNLRENTFNSNSSFNSSNPSVSGPNNSNNTNTVWRTFKGRLYTRLHDKRIAELDLNGFLNLAYLFFVIIKSFSNSSSMQTNQLKYEQVSN